MAAESAQPTSYAVLASSRSKDLPAKLIFAAFIAASAWVFAGGLIPPIWFGAVVLGQLLDEWIARPLRNSPGARISPARKRLYTAAIFFNAAVFASLSGWMWFKDDLGSVAFAILTPAGALLNLSLQLERAPRAVLPVYVPHALVLLCGPLASALVVADRTIVQMGFVTFAAGIYVAYLALAVTRARFNARALRSAVAAAERANDAKTVFLATMSHEIRTPMHAVVAAGELLRRTDLTLEQASHVSMLEGASEAMLALVNDVLDLSRIESGRFHLECVDTDLHQKLQAVSDLWRPGIESAGLRLTVDAGDLPDHAVIDPLRFKQILLNLVSNAVKFTTEGEIGIRGGRTDKTLWVEVRDTGRGMDPGTLERIFDRFEQGSTTVTREHGGSGLGLSISRSLAELMGGTLVATSEDGVGSTFRVELPLVLAEAHGGSLPVASEDIDLDRLRGLEILVADDHEMNRRIIGLMLEPFDVCLAFAENGAEAVAMAADRPFDLILMDMQMPIMDGLEATRLIRERGVNTKTPVLAFTANALEAHRAQWAEVEVYTFLTKPISFRTCVEELAKAVGADWGKGAPTGGARHAGRAA